MNARQGGQGAPRRSGRWWLILGITVLTSLSSCGGETSKVAASVGRECAADPDCGEGLVCVRPNDKMSSVGGPAHGYCTRRCDDEPTVCEPIGSQCAALDSSSGWYCFLTCKPGSNDPSKCLGRNDLACGLLFTGGGFCSPRCATDGDCSPSFCDPVRGVCVSEQAPPVAVGDPCQSSFPPILDPQCPCLALEPIAPAGICTSPCVVGRVGACGDGARCGSIFGGTAPGDYDHCLQTCTGDTDCLAGPPFRCVLDADGNGVCKL